MARVEPTSQPGEAWRHELAVELGLARLRCRVRVRARGRGRVRARLG